MLFDTHTHLNANKFKRDQQEVIERARLMGVKGMAIVGFDYPTIKEAQRLGEQNDDMVSMKEVTNDLNQVFLTLAEPLNKIMNVDEVRGRLK